MGPFRVGVSCAEPLRILDLPDRYPRLPGCQRPPVYTDGADLWALPFDLEAGQATGDPIVVARDTAVPTVSRDGTLAYVRGAGVVLRQLVLVDRNGDITTRLGKPSDMWAMYALSPDGHRAVTTSDSSEDIYLHDDRGAMVRATFTDIEHDMISFSPDGRQLYFSTGTETEYRIGSKTVDSSDPEKVIVKFGDMGPYYYAACPFSSGDGTILFYSAKGKDRKQDIAWVDLTGESDPKRFLSSAAAEYGAVPSPINHKYIAYVSDESGRHQVYLTTFPDADVKLAVSVDGGLWPRWKGDGSELYFADGGDIFAASVTYDPLRITSPVKLFSRPENDDRQPFGWPATFEVTADGERFLVTDPVKRENAEPLIAIIPYWAASFGAASSELPAFPAWTRSSRITYLLRKDDGLRQWLPERGSVRGATLDPRIPRGHKGLGLGSCRLDSWSAE